MRRFVNSLPCKVTCHLVIAGLVMPFLTLLTANRAFAQTTQRPRWAVVDFVDSSKKGGDNLGAVASEAVNAELVKIGKYDVEPQETVARKAAELGLQQPVTDKTSLMRLAQDLRVGTLVAGEVKAWDIKNVDLGKRASVVVRVVIYDVASGIPINGAALQSSSSVRPSDAPNDALLRDAIANAASLAVNKINTQTLPEGTVLNTQGSVGSDRDMALVNQGSRDGFKKDQQVIVIRGREQVATARVVDVEPEFATVKVTSSNKGITPGDRVRVVFDVPDIEPRVSKDDTVRAPRRSRGDSGLISVLLILGVVALALSGGRGSDTDLAKDVGAEAVSDVSGTPGVRVSWARDLFVRGNSQAYAWQVYRNDVLGTPVAVAPGNLSSVVDTSTARDVSYSDFGGQIGGITCDFSDPQLTTATAVAGVTAGRTYTYSVALVYKIAAIDLPDGGNTGGSTTGGTTAGTTTTGTTTTGTTTTGTTTTGTTGGTTGTTGTSASECYFISTRVNAKGPVTPLAKVGLVAPAANSVVTAPIPFSFTSAVNGSFPTTVSYVLQISTSPVFPKGATSTVARMDRPDAGTLSTPSVDTSALFTTATELWWRVGARAVIDKPGPAADANGERYIFSEPRRFTRPGVPPPPPGRTGGTTTTNTQTNRRDGNPFTNRNRRGGGN
ncbi:MAG: hypothetical protein KIS66_15275 [Fimbriimonadaceae bacterium]|nr:hypothetical protein [Fimbriimonadaceae bacterium]